MAVSYRRLFSVEVIIKADKVESRHHRGTAETIKLNWALIEEQELKQDDGHDRHCLGD